MINNWRRYWAAESTAWAWLAVLAIVLIVSLFYVSVSHDHAWLLHSASLLLHNDRPHQPISDPFIVNRLMYLLPVLLHKWLGWHVLFAFKVYSITMLLAVVALYYRLLLVISGNRRLNVWMLFVLLPLVFIPVIDFSQRDHWVMCFLLAYVFLIAARRLDRPVMPAIAALTGMLAAIAVLLKPHYVLVLIALELYLLFWHRSVMAAFRPETLIIAVMGISYFAGTLWFMPQAFTHDLPSISQFYWTYSAPWSERVPIAHVVVWVVLVGSLRVPLSPPAGYLRWLALVAIASAWVAFLLLGNTWPYRQFPFVGLVWAYFWSGFFYWRSRSPKQDGAPAAGRLVAGVNGLLVIVVFFAVMSGKRADFSDWLHGGRMHWAINLRSMQQMEKAMADLPPVDSLFVMDANLYPYTLYMMQYGLSWPSRYHSMWMLPAWARIQAGEIDVEPEKLAKMTATIDEFNRNMAVDLKAEMPDAILVDVSDEKQFFEPTSFDYISYFQNNVPYFRVIWPQYRYIKTFTVGRDGSRHVAIYLNRRLLRNHRDLPASKVE